MRAWTQSHDGHGAFPVIVFERISDQDMGPYESTWPRPAPARNESLFADDARRALQRAHEQAHTERGTLRTGHAGRIRRLRQAADKKAAAPAAAPHTAQQGAAVITKKTPAPKGRWALHGGLSAPGAAVRRLFPGGGGRGGAAGVSVFESVTVSFQGDDFGAARQAVGHGCCGGVAAECFAPAAEGFAGSHDEAGAFAAG